MWLCGARAPHDYCLDAQSITTIHADLTQTTRSLSPATKPKVDCFYVYPSLDLTSPAGNKTDFSNLPYIVDWVHAQAAPFAQTCKVYAPLYHQATLNSYFSSNPDQYLEVAYADVAAAFSEYMAKYNQGRDFVLVGHSQGSHMLRRLIQRQVENNPCIAAHLAVAILGGPLGDVTVPKGKLVGGTFARTPLCTGATQRDCVITWNTGAKGYEPPASWPLYMVAAGQDLGCTNPAALGGGMATLGGSLFFTQFHDPNIVALLPQSTGVSTAFAELGGFYTGVCVPNVSGLSFFEVDLAGAAGDKRTNPIPFGDPAYSPSQSYGLHGLDLAFPMQELLGAVSSRL
jgi:hypothetical protein